MLDFYAKLNTTYCVLSVKAADVMDEGKFRPLMISCHCFLLITSTKPPRAQTKLYNSYKSKTCFAIIGNLLIGVPRKEQKQQQKLINLYLCQNVSIYETQHGHTAYNIFF